MNGRADLIPKAPIPRKLRYNFFLFCPHATPLNLANEWNGTRANSFESHERSCRQWVTQRDVMREVINWTVVNAVLLLSSGNVELDVSKMKISSRLLKWILSSFQKKTSLSATAFLLIQRYQSKQILYKSKSQQTFHFISHHISKLNNFMKETFYDNRRVCLT